MNSIGRRIVLSLVLSLPFLGTAAPPVAAPLSYASQCVVDCNESWLSCAKGVFDGCSSAYPASSPERIACHQEGMVLCRAITHECRFHFCIQGEPYP